MILNNISTNNFSIHCFEPGFETFKTLRESSENDNRIILNNIGIGKEKNEAILHYDSAGTAARISYKKITRSY